MPEEGIAEYSPSRCREAKALKECCFCAARGVIVRQQITGDVVHDRSWHQHRLSVFAQRMRHAVHRLHHGFKPLLMVSIVLLLLAIVAVFIEIAFVSDYVFWVMEANYLMIVAATGSSYLIIVTK